MLLVEEPARLTVTIAAELASIRIPACWMIKVVGAKGRAKKSVRVAGEPVSGALLASQQLITNNVMNGEL